MQPHNLYQGSAPAAMAQMGQGLAETGASISRSIQSGYDALGKGLASGITNLASGYSEMKNLQSSIKSSEKLYESIKDNLDPNLRKNFDNQIAAMNADTSLSTRDKAMFWNDAKSFIGGAVNNQYRMQLQGMQEGAAMARTQAQIAAEQARQTERIKAARQEALLRGGFGGSPMIVPRSSADLFNPNFQTQDENDQGLFR